MFVIVCFTHFIDVGIQSVFGLYDNEPEAQLDKERLEQNYPDCRYVIKPLCSNHNICIKNTMRIKNEGGLPNPPPSPPRNSQPVSRPM